jgi:hypothetical protein
MALLPRCDSGAYRCIQYDFGAYINERIWRLIRTLVSTPDLARFIQILIIEHFVDDIDEDYPPASIDVQLLEPVVESANYPDDGKSAWLLDLQEG